MRDTGGLTPTNRGYLAALGSAVFLSLTAILIRYLTLTFQLPALVLAFWREVLVALILAAILAVAKPALLRGVRAHFPFLAAYGLVLALFNAAWTLSVVYNGASVATVLAYGSAAFTVLLGWLVLREKLTLVKLASVALSLTGCAMIVDALSAEAWALNAAGMLTGFSAGLLYAVYSLMGRAAALRGLNPWTTLYAIFAIASLYMLAFNLGSGGALPGSVGDARGFFWLGDSLSGWGALLLLAGGPTLLGYGLYNVSLKHLPSSVANLVLTIEPLLTALVAYFAFGEVLTTWQLAGGGLIMAGVLLLRLGKAE